MYDQISELMNFKYVEDVALLNRNWNARKKQDQLIQDFHLDLQ